MKQLTVKDFINYNGPCFSCGKLPELYIQVTANQPVNFDRDIRPSLDKKCMEIVLSYKYDKNLLMWIEYETNKVSFSNFSEIAQFLSDFKIKIKKKCNECQNCLCSSYLEWNLPKQYLKPITLDWERIVLKDETYIYYIYNSYTHNKSSLQSDRLDNNIRNTFKVETPLISLRKFSNKERLINKIKTYMLFS